MMAARKHAMRGGRARLEKFFLITGSILFLRSILYSQKENTVRKVIVSEFVTLDGIMEAPEKWQSPYLSDDVVETIQAQILAYGAMLLGRVTYEEFAAYWPSQTKNEFGIADKLNSMPKFVVSSTLQKVDWNNSRLIKENVVEEISKLKQQSGGNIQMTGSATLVQALMQTDLIDEYQLMVHPVVLGSGKRLFRNGSEKKILRLVETKSFSSGVVVLTYQPIQQ
jgi:dihydrofolate reductase